MMLPLAVRALQMRVSVRVRIDRIAEHRRREFLSEDVTTPS